MQTLPLVIFQILQQILAYQTLYYEAFNSQTFELGNWSMMNKFSANTQSSCGSTQLFGGYQILGQNSIITNLIPLKPHSSIRITFDFWMIDNWNPTDKLIFFLDSDILYENSLANTNMNNICGDNLKQEGFTSLDLAIEHNFKNALIIINTQQSSADVFWGIRNFKLYIEECPIGCLVCNNGDSQQLCITWSLAYESLTDMNFLAANGWNVQSNSSGPSIYQCQNISILCGYNSCGNGDSIQNSIQLPIHSKIKVQFRFFKLDSWDNEQASFIIDNIISWTRTFSYNGGQALCGSTRYEDKIQNIEINMHHVSKNINIEFKSNLNEEPNNESFGIRDFLIFVNNKCDDLYYNECCGDKIKQIGEECDDGNMIPFDGCHNCQYSCINGCLQCIKGQCLECQDGYIQRTREGLYYLLQYIICDINFSEQTSTNIETKAILQLILYLQLITQSIMDYHIHAFLSSDQTQLEMWSFFLIKISAQ